MLQPTKIIVIHDGLETRRAEDPLLVSLKISFPACEVIHFENSNIGLEYVLKNLNQKIIVILDINFSEGELSGVQVFEGIRKQTSLVYVIMVTARSLKEINNNDLISMINNDALAIENVFSYPKIIKLVEDAVHKLDVRVDSVLEEWITKQTEEKREMPYLKIKGGKTYTLNDILKSIREQTELGRQLERNILKLAIDLLVRQKTQLDD